MAKKGGKQRGTRDWGRKEINSNQPKKTEREQEKVTKSSKTHPLYSILVMNKMNHRIQVVMDIIEDFPCKWDHICG